MLSTLSAEAKKSRAANSIWLRSPSSSSFEVRREIMNWCEKNTEMMIIWPKSSNFVLLVPTCCRADIFIEIVFSLWIQLTEPFICYLRDYNRSAILFTKLQFMYDDLIAQAQAATEVLTQFHSKHEQMSSIQNSKVINEFCLNWEEIQNQFK